MSQVAYVKMWEEDVVIPTYPVGDPDKNPMFLEKRVYQGSSGKVYPLPVIDKIADEKIDRTYKMVFLENQYIQIAILPELGGRVQRAYDKTNGYDFVYYNQVIKPALVGLAGPWISGGIEFNWPQHHRPSTFMPVEYCLEENADGSKTVWVSEIDRMYGTKGMAGFTLYPDKAYLEIKGQLYNRTPLPQTFLWWANPAVAVNDQYKSVFPPDVHAVFDHGKRAVSKFPIATGEYYKVDYSAGVDISRYKNIPVPTSYMAYHSDYDFVGGYDFGAQAGILHVANHHISPGKKQWTWGYGDFGQAWDYNLTDTDGPYVELMTGVYTDNQPDFTWLQPYEEKCFTQYFMPYKQIGEVKNATVDALLNLDFVGNQANVAVYVTSERTGIRVLLATEDAVYLDETVDLSPQAAYLKQVNIAGHVAHHLYQLSVFDAQGRLLASYQPEPEQLLKTPDPAKPAPAPAEIQHNEELFLTGLHLEQYRHATYDPDPYYLEGLRRDPGDIRINNAYGLLLMRRGLWQESERYFRAAIRTLTQKNPNPYDTEPYYNLGLALQLQGRLDEAFAAFYKAVWSGAWQGSGYFALAQIACARQRYGEALELIERSIVRNYHNIKARNLKCAILRHLGRYDAAAAFANETLAIDKLDFAARYELMLLHAQKGDPQAAERHKADLTSLLRDSHHNYLELASDYAAAGLWNEAGAILRMLVDRAASPRSVYPMVYYYLGYYARKQGNDAQAAEWYQLAGAACPDYCFPNRLTDIIVLEDAMAVSPTDAKAPFYLGNLLYDKKQYQRAIELWEKSRDLDGNYAIVHRNLALGYYNKAGQPQQALASLEKAFALNREDARVLFELDQLKKKLGVPHEERLAFLHAQMHLVEKRDDLYVEYVTLCNNLGRYTQALDLLMRRQFHPWEGGEGKVTAQYVYCHIQLARQALRDKLYEKAIRHLENARTYPRSLGEGKLAGAQDNHIKYYLGCAYAGMGDAEQARSWFQEAAKGSDELADAMFYNDQPADMLFFQGLALLKLGETDAARSRFNRLYDYGEKHIGNNVTIDYFAVSLPDFLVFDEDLNRKNQVHCRYLMGLGCLGRGEYAAASEHLGNALAMDRNHQGALTYLQMAAAGEGAPA